ncbi:hypothetical protein GE061_018855 [Apolygus lucorum]|uniref:Ion transport domain-containing protein n=1 Tax=Apolygus lucorum TaxID=248454 RepID=A0A8S9X879_APOLU|nr:hypothetical protein GE061_018855 [Apolygus lucorum]
MDRLTARINDLARKLREELVLSKALLADNASSSRDLEDALARLQGGLSFFKETDDQLTNRPAGSSRRRQTPDPDEAQSAATIVDTRWEAEQTLALLSMRIKKLDRTWGIELFHCSLLLSDSSLCILILQPTPPAPSKGDIEDIEEMAESSSPDPSSQYASLFIFKEDNALRRKCKAIVTWTPFEYAILLIIIINCIILGFGLYLPEENETGQLLEKTEIYFLIVFLVEMVLKVIAYGFAFHPGSYLRNPWNLIDFFVIIVGIVSFFPLGIELSTHQTPSQQELKRGARLKILQPLTFSRGTLVSAEHHILSCAFYHQNIIDYNNDKIKFTNILRKK